LQVQHVFIRKQERLLRKRPSAKDSQEQNNNGKEIFAAVSEPELNVRSKMCIQQGQKTTKAAQIYLYFCV
jgi:hypothetical protein